MIRISIILCCTAYGLTICLPMSEFDPLHREIMAARDEARIELDRALVALGQCDDPVDGAWDEAREAVLRNLAGKLHDLLVQEELLASLESIATSMMYDIEPSLQHLARKCGGSNDGGTSPQT
jgi:hypothetical protein